MRRPLALNDGECESGLDGELGTVGHGLDAGIAYDVRSWQAYTEPPAGGALRQHDAVHAGCAGLSAPDGAAQAVYATPPPRHLLPLHSHCGIRCPRPCRPPPCRPSPLGSLGCPRPPGGGRPAGPRRRPTPLPLPPTCRRGLGPCAAGPRRRPTPLATCRPPQAPHTPGSP